jgi:hypothetical protein
MLQSTFQMFHPTYDAFFSLSLCVYRKSKCDGVKPICTPCLTSGREVRMMIMIFYNPNPAFSLPFLLSDRVCSAFLSRF